MCQSINDYKYFKTQSVCSTFISITSQITDKFLRPIFFVPKVTYEDDMENNTVWILLRSMCKNI